MIRRTILAGVLILGIAAPALVYAEHTRFWRQSDYSDFEKGTAKGVAIRSDGRLMPAPKFAAYSDPNLAYLWALRIDSRGRIYGAGGSDAKVLRFDDPAKPTTVFESPELAAQTITFDSHDNLYVGTSPDGKIYKVTPEGQKSVFFDPKSKYIWALAVDGQGVLFAGTGDEGKIFAVTPDGKAEIFYQSDERHARALAFDSKGNLLVGTDPDGLVLRIEMSRKASQEPPRAGASFVLYETDKKEVTSLSPTRVAGFSRRDWRKAAAAGACAGHGHRHAATPFPPKRAAGLDDAGDRDSAGPACRALHLLPLHYRRLGRRGDIPRRRAHYLVELARGLRILHGPLFQWQNSSWHRKQGRHHRTGGQ